MDNEIFNLLQDSLNALESNVGVQDIYIDYQEVREVKERLESALDKERTIVNAALEKERNLEKERKIVEDAEIKIIANRIVIKLDEDEQFKSKVQMSPEPLRTMIYESGVVPNPEMIDGSDYYHKIVDEIERIY